MHLSKNCLPFFQFLYSALAAPSVWPDRLGRKLKISYMRFLQLLAESFVIPFHGFAYSLGLIIINAGSSISLSHPVGVDWHSWDLLDLELTRLFVGIGRALRPDIRLCLHASWRPLWLMWRGLDSPLHSQRWPRTPGWVIESRAQCCQPSSGAMLYHRYDARPYGWPSTHYQPLSASSYPICNAITPHLENTSFQLPVVITQSF